MLTWGKSIQQIDTEASGYFAIPGIFVYLFPRIVTKWVPNKLIKIFEFFIKNAGLCVFLYSTYNLLKIKNEYVCPIFIALMIGSALLVFLKVYAGKAIDQLIDDL